MTWQVVTVHVVNRPITGIRSTHVDGPIFKRRRDAEAFAARRSAFAGDSFVRPVGGHWVSYYRNGYLHDSKDRRATEGAPREPYDRTREQLAADWRKWMVAS